MTLKEIESKLKQMESISKHIPRGSGFRLVYLLPELPNNFCNHDVLLFRYQSKLQEPWAIKTEGGGALDFYKSIPEVIAAIKEMAE